jgi:hypothetical protein
MTLRTIALAAALAAAAPAFAGSQVEASPGVSLTEAAQAKFNRDTRGDDRHVKPVPGNSDPSPQLYAAAGLTVGEGRAMTLNQVFIAKINRESRGDDQQRLAVDEPVTTISRAYGQGGDYRQLAASVGVGGRDVRGLSLDEIAAAKFANGTD